MVKVTNTLLTKIGIFLLLAGSLFTSCKSEETYAEQKKRESSAINDFIAKQGIKSISEETFKQQGETTNVENNEYVLFESTGVYMQIVDKGTGKKLGNNETADVLCRFKEYNLNTGLLQTSNIGVSKNSMMCDNFTVKNTLGTFTATFNYGIIQSTYGTSSVPAGWLIPLTYINLGRDGQSETSTLAHVRIIVPHNQGHTAATNSVYACFYDIFYESGPEK